MKTWLTEWRQKSLEIKDLTYLQMKVQLTWNWVLSFTITILDSVENLHRWCPLVLLFHIISTGGDL